MSDEFEFVKDDDSDPWWAMVKTNQGPVPVRVSSWWVNKDGAWPNLTSLRGVDTSPGNVIELKRMHRNEAWRQVAEWNKSRDRVAISESLTAQAKPKPEATE
jgi:hypothetical protein